MLRYARAFDWWTARGLAYEYLRYELCLRTGEPCEHLQPLELAGRRGGRSMRRAAW